MKGKAAMDRHQTARRPPPPLPLLLLVLLLHRAPLHQALHQMTILLLQSLLSEAREGGAEAEVEAVDSTLVPVPVLVEEVETGKGLLPLLLRALRPGKVLVLVLVLEVMQRRSEHLDWTDL